MAWVYLSMQISSSKESHHFPRAGTTTLGFMANNIYTVCDHGNTQIEAKSDGNVTHISIHFCAETKKIPYVDLYSFFSPTSHMPFLSAVHI